jgi:N6-L-threonylcarbamoyladenine synthase
MILSIESSCDDSSIAITDIETKKLIYHKKISQECEHAKYGGVVPELAARLHAEALPKILQECKEYFDKLKAVAVTSSPGLSVTLMEGVMMAKAISMSLNIPIISVNHLKGHIYSLFIDKEAVLPQTVLLVSGGHTQIIEVSSYEDMKLVATTIDDSFGESFDKVSKMLGMGYPGGPLVQQKAQNGDNSKVSLPIPLSQSPKIAFSYSGLKNAVRLEIEKCGEGITEENICDIAASFQTTAVKHIIQKTKKYLKNSKCSDNFAIVGGASANIELRTSIEKLCKEFGMSLHLAELKWCSDNAAMIGRVAIEAYHKKEFVSISELEASSKSSY